MEKEIYWIWLQQCWGYGRKTEKFSAAFPDAKSVYDASKEERKAVFAPCFNSRMEKTDLQKAKEVYSFCKEHKIHVITPESEFYPRRLLTIEDYPLVLYARGDISVLQSELSIAVIGSRTCSAYGEEVTEKIVRGLSQNKVTVISGGALGIDSVAHKAAIENGSKTVLVMGCGHGYGYLPENSELRKAVANCGVLVTEYPPFYPVDHGSFPKRNRIISGMSDGVLVTEAAKNSGTFSTVNHAKRQGRTIFALPGDIISKKFDGSNQLIVEGAIPVFSGEAILQKYGIEAGDSYFEKSETPFEKIDERGKTARKGKAPSKKKKIKESEKAENKTEKITEKRKNPPEGISKNALMVYNVMSEGICELDGITRKSGMEIGTVLAAISELEIFGVVSKSGPNTYEIN